MLRYLLVRLLVLPAVFLLPIILRAAPIALEKSVSPDGRYFLEIESTSDDPNGAPGKVHICETANKEAVASFDYFQYSTGFFPTSAKVLWNPNNRAFALTTDSSKNFASSDIYVRDGSEWVQVAIPKIETKHSEKNGWQMRSTGEFVVEAWQSNDALKMIYENGVYRFSNAGQMEVAGPLSVYLRLFQNKLGPALSVSRIVAEATKPED